MHCTHKNLFQPFWICLDVYLMDLLSYFSLLNKPVFTYSLANCLKVPDEYLEKYFSSIIFQNYINSFLMNIMPDFICNWRNNQNINIRLFSIISTGYRTKKNNLYYIIRFNRLSNSRAISMRLFILITKKDFYTLNK